MRAASVLLIGVIVATSTTGCVVWRDDSGSGRGAATADPGEIGSGSEPGESSSSDGARGGGQAAAHNGQPADALAAQPPESSGAAAQSPDAGADAVQPSDAATDVASAFAPPPFPPNYQLPTEGSVWPSRVRVPTVRPTAVPTLVPTAEPTPEPTPTAPPTPTEDPFTAAGRPVHMEAPAIGVDAYMEQVGLTSEQAMDVPREWGNVAWYRRGYRPGELGNAVIAGHLDTSSGGPAVFWSLHELTPGDEIYVTYENGDRYTFVVEGSEYYLHDAQGPVIDRIFGESLTPDLNLITCDGAWDHGQATYSHRLVVFTTLAPDQTVSADSPATID